MCDRHGWFDYSQRSGERSGDGMTGECSTARNTWHLKGLYREFKKYTHPLRVTPMRVLKTHATCFLGYSENRVVLHAHSSQYQYHDSRVKSCTKDDTISYVPLYIGSTSVGIPDRNPA